MATDEGIAFSRMEVPGIIVDSSGNKWTLPADSLEPGVELVSYKSPFAIPHPDPLMDYQFENEKDVNDMISQQFVPVTQREQGADGFKPIGEYGVANDGLYRVQGMVAMKIPKALMKMRRAGEKALADAPVRGVQKAQLRSLAGEERGDRREKEQMSEVRGEITHTKVGRRTSGTPRQE